MRLKQAEDRDRHDGLLEVSNTSATGGGDIGAIDKGSQPRLTLKIRSAAAP